MGDPLLFSTAATIQQGVTLPKLLELMEDTVDPGDLPSYGAMAPGVPALQGLGTLRDAVERVGSDPGASLDPTYGAIMYAAALVEVASAQQERIEALEAKLERKVAAANASKPSSKAGKKGGAEK